MSLAPEALNKLESIAKQICEREGCELYELEFVSGSKGKGRIVRIYVDRKDQQVSLGDCEKVSQAMNLLLDVEDLIPGGEYSLEVSTPGLERKLSKPEHYQASIGKMVQVKTHESMTEHNPGFENAVKRMNAKGALKEVKDNGFVMDVDGADMFIPFNIVDKTKVVFDFDANKGQKKK